MPEPSGEQRREPRATSSGPGRVLIAVYAIFALSATARAGVQIAAKFAEAPVAYLLSGLAGVVYILATIGLAGRGPGYRRLAWGAVVFELVGVLVVGTLTVFDTGDFPDDTVWSVYGRGYGFIPLVLPFVGLWWLRRTSPKG
ncbi:membrane protein [Pseudonocardia yuanmonensis]|uniref:Membrane protein n=1 Tax=Pseudonocardia yuanmonensis TaxID=1095914 RepID=A0ABP8WBF7_9PSEU